MNSVARKIPHAAWLAVPLACVLYFWGLDRAGLLGPDEPRYAAVAQAMARTGDWVTPRLWGEPWFEKPALLYWMTASGFRLGLGAELAPRLPVAALALAFLAFYWWMLRREYGTGAACYSALILGTSLGWVGFSQIGVTDLPMTAFYAAAMLLALPWVSRYDARLLPAAAALLGLAVLAKGLVPLVLALPLVMRGRIRELVRLRVITPFLVFAVPWYVLCYARNGAVFPKVFFWQHHFSRFTSPDLQHSQPWWFYVPVLLAGLLPWAPLLFLARVKHSPVLDYRRWYLLFWVVLGFIFFSVAANKLPGYLLPLLPAISALMGIGLAEAANARVALAACGLLLVVFPIAATILPQAVAGGLSRASLGAWNWIWLLPGAAMALVWLLESHGPRIAAAGLVAAGAASGYLYLKSAVMPEVDRQASARGLWQRIEPHAADVCVEGISRAWRYGLNYYSTTPLPECNEGQKPMVVRQARGAPPDLAPSTAGNQR